MLGSPSGARPLAERLALLETRVAELQAALDRSETARVQAEDARRAADERYLLALRASQDGLWEWDIAGGAVQLSPRWKSMLGFAPDEIADSRAGWLARVHPDDRAAFEAALARALEGDDDAVDHELRLLHKDGRPRHVLSRAVALRRASGAPYRMVGLDTDITRVRRVTAIVDALVDGTTDVWGEALFAAIVRHFGRAVGVDRVFLTECADEDNGAGPEARPSRVRALADWRADGSAGERFEYALAGTPCEQVIHEGRPCFYPSGLGHRFPVEQGWQAYLGLPVVGSDARVLGHLAFLHRGELRAEDVPVERVARVFLARAAAEMERLRSAQRG